jgi:hypothetical protein
MLKSSEKGKVHGHIISMEIVRAVITIQHYREHRGRRGDLISQDEGWRLVTTRSKMENHLSPYSWYQLHQR